MQTLTHGYRGLRLIAHLNTDRILFVGTMAGALVLSGYLATFL
ncbi:hypothetical protein [Marinovum sp.]|nr:hypothetical protein [Marinovum sp.]